MREKIDWEALKRFSYEIYVDLKLKSRIAGALEKIASNQQIDLLYQASKEGEKEESPENAAIEWMNKGREMTLKELGEEIKAKKEEKAGSTPLPSDSTNTPIRDMELARSLYPKTHEREGWEPEAPVTLKTVRYSKKEGWEVKGAKKGETEKAILISIGNDEQWFPKSTVKMKEDQMGLVQWIKIQSWILKKRGLIEEAGN